MTTLLDRLAEELLGQLGRVASPAWRPWRSRPCGTASAWPRRTGTAASIRCSRPGGLAGGEWTGTPVGREWRPRERPGRLEWRRVVGVAGATCGRGQRHRHAEAVLGRHDRADDLAHGRGPWLASSSSLPPAGGACRPGRRTPASSSGSSWRRRSRRRRSSRRSAGWPAGPTWRTSMRRGDPAEGAVVDVLGVELVALVSCQRTSMALRKPIFSNALFHSRMPSSTYGPVLVRDGVLDPPDDLLLGRRELGARSRPSPAASG